MMYIQINQKRIRQRKMREKESHRFHQSCHCIWCVQHMWACKQCKLAKWIDCMYECEYARPRSLLIQRVEKCLQTIDDEQFLVCAALFSSSSLLAKSSVRRWLAHHSISKKTRRKKSSTYEIEYRQALKSICSHFEKWRDKILLHLLFSPACENLSFHLISHFEWTLLFRLFAHINCQLAKRKMYGKKENRENRMPFRFFFFIPLFRWLSSARARSSDSNVWRSETSESAHMCITIKITFWNIICRFSEFLYAERSALAWSKTLSNLNAAFSDFFFSLRLLVFAHSFSYMFFFHHRYRKDLLLFFIFFLVVLGFNCAHFT